MSSTYEQTAKTLKHIADDLADASGDKLDGMLRDFEHTFDKGQIDAGATVGFRLGRKLEKAVTIDTFEIIPGAALTAHASNNATVALKYDDGAGGSETTIATVDTDSGGSGSWAVGVAIPVTISTPVSLAAGTYLILDVSKNASGVVVPASSFYVSGSLT